MPRGWECFTPCPRGRHWAHFSPIHSSAIGSTPTRSAHICLSCTVLPRTSTHPENAIPFWQSSRFFLFAKIPIAFARRSSFHPKLKLKQDIALPNFIAYAPDVVPILAKREVLSLPRNPDGLRHTVVAPPQVKLKQDVDLRNFISHGPADLPVLAKRAVLSLPRNPDSLRHTVVAPPQVEQNVDLRNFIGYGPEHVPALAKREVPALPRNPD